MISQSERVKERLGIVLAVVGMVVFTTIGQAVVLAQQIPTP
jgi:hypothetical protein